MHLLVGVGLSALRLAIPIKLAIWMVIALSLMRTLLALRKSLPSSIKLRADGAFDLVHPSGIVQTHQVDESTTVLPWLIILRYGSTSGKCSLVLPPDAIDEDGHRRMRTWLRWRAKIS